MKVAKCFFACGGCFFRSIGGNPPNALAAFGYDGLPSPRLLNKVDSYKSRPVVALHSFIATVRRSIRHPQVANSVVGPNTVFVIDLVRPPLIVDKQPRKNVRGVVLALANLYFNVARSVLRSSYSSCVSRVPLLRSVRAPSPSEHTRGWAVQQDSTHKIGAQRREFARHFVSRISMLTGLHQLPSERNILMWRI